MREIHIFRSASGLGGQRQKITGTIEFLDDGWVAIVPDTDQEDDHNLITYQIGEELYFPPQVIEYIR